MSAHAQCVGTEQGQVTLGYLEKEQFNVIGTKVIIKGQGQILHWLLNVICCHAFRKTQLGALVLLGMILSFEPDYDVSRKTNFKEKRFWQLVYSKHTKNM